MSTKLFLLRHPLVIVISKKYHNNHNLCYRETTMKITGNTILITGGATGIGLSLARSLVDAGNTVLVCGRRDEKLRDAKTKIPQIHTRACDVSKENEREALYDWASRQFLSLNMLINNAGIQNTIDLRKGMDDLINNGSEIETNLTATVYLSARFIPWLTKKNESAIVNVSSGLAFAPIAIMPVYCATKAAVHSFTMSLRHQLKDTSIKVFELIPPIVDTELDRGARDKRGQTDRGIPPAVVAAEAMKAFEDNVYECAVGQAAALRIGSRKDPEQLFNNMNR
jgi:uncharacterized oxidoreductase